MTLVFGLKWGNYHNRISFNYQRTGQHLLGDLKWVYYIGLLRMLTLVKGHCVDR